MVGGGRVFVTCIRPVIVAEANHAAPAAISLQQVWIADDDEQRLRAGDCHVESLGILNKPQVEGSIAVQVTRCGADGRYYHHPTLLA